MKINKVLRIRCLEAPWGDYSCSGDFILPIKPGHLKKLNKILEIGITHVHEMHTIVVKNLEKEQP